VEDPSSPRRVHTVNLLSIYVQVLVLYSSRKTDNTCLESHRYLIEPIQHSSSDGTN
jgi:hypothetical protein